ncbi:MULTISPECIES: hypothetical protein [unclassified Nostoc]|nr:hypothetical protein [Nostoc sp. JL34]MBN3885498.1 hypothetical protein [Nostoc sp. JL34]
MEIRENSSLRLLLMRSTALLLKETLRERASYGRRLQSDRSAYFQSQIR